MSTPTRTGRGPCPSRRAPHLLLTAVLTVAGLAGAARADQADQHDDALADLAAPIGQAVDRALAFLADQQLDSGAWQAPMGTSTGVSSLCVMAFLSAGHVPGQGPYGEVVNRGIDYVLASAKPNGMVIDQTTHGPMYCHGIATLLLCEVTGMVDAARQARIDQVLPAALRVILDAQQVPKNQNHQGGWRYQPTSRDSDLSCAGWQLLSLRAARNSGARVPLEAIDLAVAYVLRCANEDGGFAYQPGQGSGFARTGTGVLALQVCGLREVPQVVAGVDWMLRNPERRVGGTFFYYGVYYASQAMFQAGGEPWAQYAQQLYPLLLGAQRDDGGWAAGSSHEASAGRGYSTAMSVLALTVSYRQLPIYQR